MRSSQIHAVLEGAEEYGDLTSNARTATEDMEAQDTTVNNNDTPGHRERRWSALMKDPTYRDDFYYTMWLLFSFVCLGCAVEQRGPSLLDLQLITGIDTEQGSALITSGAVGYLCGSLLCGFLYDHYNEYFLLASAITGMGVSHWSIPLCQSYVLMIAMFCISGIFAGGLDTGGNTEVLRVWGTNSRHYVHAVNFGFAFGAVLSPLYTDPFLAPVQDSRSSLSGATGCVSSITTVSPTVPLSASITAATTSMTATANSTTEATSPVPETRLFYAYTITGLLTLLSAVPFAVTFYRSHTLRKTPPLHDIDSTRPVYRTLFLDVALALLDLFYLFYCAAEDAFGVFLATFVVKQLCWTKTQASQITAAFYGSFAASRFLAIFYSEFVRPVRLLVTSTVFMMISCVLVAVSSLNEYVHGIWISVILMGASMSTIFPTGFLFVEEELTEVTGEIASTILVSSSLGAMLAPPILGYLMNAYSNMWFAYLLLVISVLCSLALLILIIYARLVLVKFKNPAATTRNSETSTTCIIPLQESSPL